jgi:hypothetical protein
MIELLWDEEAGAYTRDGFTFYRTLVGGSFYGEFGVALIVARYTPEVGDWRCFLGAAPAGSSTEEAVEYVAAHGDQMRKDHGDLLFPALAEQYKWRY